MSQDMITYAHSVSAANVNALRCLRNECLGQSVSRDVFGDVLQKQSWHRYFGNNRLRERIRRNVTTVSKMTCVVHSSVPWC